MNTVYLLVRLPKDVINFNLCCLAPHSHVVISRITEDGYELCIEKIQETHLRELLTLWGERAVEITSL